MSDLRRTLLRPASLILLALNFLLLGCLVGTLMHPWRAQLPPVAPLDSLPALPATGSGGASLSEDYAALIARPVFHRDRTYTPPPKVEAVVVQTPLPDYTVTGFMAVPGRPGKAFLREHSGGRSLTVAVGDSVDGWTVVAAGAKQVEIRQGQRSALLTRGGPPIEGGSTVRDAPAMATPKPPLELPKPQEAASPPPVPAASSPAPPVRTTAAPLSPMPSAPVPPPEKPKPQSSVMEAQPIVTLNAVTVRKPQPFGPPTLAEPRGPLLTYVPPDTPAN